MIPFVTFMPYVTFSYDADVVFVLIGLLRADRVSLRHIRRPLSAHLSKAWDEKGGDIY